MISSRQITINKLASSQTKSQMERRHNTLEENESLANESDDGSGETSSSSSSSSSESGGRIGVAEFDDENVNEFVSEKCIDLRSENVNEDANSIVIHSDANIEFIVRALFDKCSKVQHTLKKDDDKNNEEKEDVDKKSELISKSEFQFNYLNDNNSCYNTNINKFQYSQRPPTSSPPRSYVLCTDVINYFNRDIISANKLMTNPTNSINLSTTNNGLEQLKHLFYEHFKLDNSCLLDGYRLDFDSFNEIFFKWIEQLNRREEEEEEETGNEEKKPNSYLYSKRQQHAKKTLTSNEASISLRGASAASTHSTSSIPSITLSEDDTNVHTSEFDFSTHQNLADSSNSSFLINDLSSENRQLKQVINGLKIQLQNAEETNAQMVHEIESHVEKCNDLTRVNAELNVKLDCYVAEDEYMRKSVEFHKTKVLEYEEKINLINTQMRNLSLSLKRSEEEFVKLNAQYQECSLENEKNLNDLNEQKILNRKLKEENLTLESQFKEINFVCEEKIEVIIKLTDKLKEIKNENENLQDKLNDSEKSLMQANLKLLRKKYSASNNDNSKSNTNLVNFLPNKPKKANSNESPFNSGNEQNETISFANEMDTDEELDEEGSISVSPEILPLEAESFISLHIASNLNQNTPKPSQNENNFYLEQMENQFRKSTTKLNNTNEFESILEYINNYVSFVEKFKIQYESLSLLRDSNNNQETKKETQSSTNVIKTDLNFCYLNTSFRTMLETLIFYLFQNENSNSLKEKVEMLVNQARCLIAKNKELNKNLKQTRKKLNTIEKTTHIQQRCSSCNNNFNNDLDISANSTCISTIDYNSSLMNSTSQMCFQSSESIASMANDVRPKKDINIKKSFSFCSNTKSNSVQNLFMLSENDCSNGVQSSSQDTLNTSALSTSSNIKSSLSLIVEATNNPDQKAETSADENNLCSETNLSQFEIQTDISMSILNEQPSNNETFENDASEVFQKEEKSHETTKHLNKKSKKVVASNESLNSNTSSNKSTANNKKTPKSTIEKPSSNVKKSVSNQLLKNTAPNSTKAQVDTIASKTKTNSNFSKSRSNITPLTKSNGNTTLPKKNFKLNETTKQANNNKNLKVIHKTKVVDDYLVDAIVNDIELEKNMGDLYQTTSQTHGHRQISILSTNSLLFQEANIMRTKSLPVLFGVNESIKYAFDTKLIEIKTKPSYSEISTQTEACNTFRMKSGSSGEEYDDSSSLSINSQETKSISNKKQNHLILKHQLTRDSGIDSDTNLHQKITNHSNNRPVLKSEKKTIDEISSFNLTCTKRHLNVLKSNLIKSSFSSTRENSIDQESVSIDDSENLNENTSNSNDILNGDRDEIMVNVFSRNVVDEEENDLNCRSAAYTHFSDETFEKRLTTSNASFDAASNKRQLFKNSSKKHHTIEVSSMIKRKESLDAVGKKSFEFDVKKFIEEGDDDEETFDNHKHLLISNEPVVSFTETSKLAQKIKEANDEQLKSASNITLDDLLNLKNLPRQPSQKFSAWNNLHFSESHLEFYNDGATSSSTNIHNRSNMFRQKFDSIMEPDVSSFEESNSLSSSKENNFAEHKLKLLESNFEQVSMANYIDEPTLHKCIEAYRERFGKAEIYMQVLFDDINDSLNRLVECQGDLFEEIDEMLNSSKSCSDLSNQIESDTISTSSSNNLCEHEECVRSKRLNHVLIKQNRLLVQEKLSHLNMTFSSLRKNLINLVTTSSVISSLKQEVHLGELVKISISYVRELKKSTALAKAKLNVSNVPLNNRSHSLAYNSLQTRPMIKSLSSVPKEKSLDLIDAQSFLSETSAKSTESLPEPRKHLSWLSTISIAKTVTSHLNNNHLKKTNLEIEDHRGNDQLENLVEESNDEKTTQKINDETNSPLVSDLTEKQEKVIKPFCSYSILTNDYLFSKKTQQKLLRMQEKYIVVRDTSKVCYECASRNIKKFHNLIRKDSFQFARQTASILLVLFGLCYFFISIIVAFFRERKISETFFNFFFDNIEINNPQTNALPN